MREGWNSLPISKVCKLFTDGNWIESKDQSQSGIRLVQTGNVGLGEFKDRRNKARFISEDTFLRLKCQEVFAGDCLVSRLPDPVGRSCIVPESGDRMITAVDCTIMRFDQSVLISGFFNYYSQSEQYLSDIETYCTGATRKRISRSNLGKIEIPLPPLPEQTRIVASLDEAFAGIDAAIANTEKNLANAHELFQSSLIRCFTQSNKLPSPLIDLFVDDPAQVSNEQLKDERILPIKSSTRGRAETDRVIEGELSLSVGMPSKQPRDGWRWTKLSDIARLESGHTPSRKHPEYWNGDIPWLGIKDARAHHGGVIDDTQQHTNQLGIDNSAARILPPGTVCLSRTASVGYVVVTGAAMATSQDFVNWVCFSELDPHFLKYLLLSEGREFSKFSSGSVHQTIYFPEVKAFHICHPSVTAQRRIVDFLDEVRVTTERLESIYQQKLTGLTELKQSLLQKAFSGELTADKAVPKSTLKEEEVT